MRTISSALRAAQARRILEPTCTLTLRDVFLRWDNDWVTNALCDDYPLEQSADKVPWCPIDVCLGMTVFGRCWMDNSKMSVHAVVDFDVLPWDDTPTNSVLTQYTLGTPNMPNAPHRSSLYGDDFWHFFGTNGNIRRQAWFGSLPATTFAANAYNTKNDSYIALAAVGDYTVYLAVLHVQGEETDEDDWALPGTDSALQARYTPPFKYIEITRLEDTNHDGIADSVDICPHTIIVDPYYRAGSLTWFDAESLDDRDVIVLNSKACGCPVTVIYQDGVWAQPRTVMPSEVASNGNAFLRISGITKIADSSHRDVLWANARMVRKGTTGLYPQTLDVVLRTTDGDHWTIDRYCYLGLESMRSRLIPFFDYVYYAGRNVVKRAKRPWTMAGNVTSITIDPTEDVLQWNFNHDGARNAQTTSTALATHGGLYCSAAEDPDAPGRWLTGSGSMAVFPGLWCWRDVGWSGHEALLSIDGIDVVPGSYRSGDRQLAFSGRGMAMRLIADWACDMDWQWCSQVKHYDDCDQATHLYSASATKIELAEEDDESVTTDFEEKELKTNITGELEFATYNKPLIAFSTKPLDADNYSIKASFQFSHDRDGVDTSPLLEAARDTGRVGLGHNLRKVEETGHAATLSYGKASAGSNVCQKDGTCARDYGHYFHDSARDFYGAATSALGNSDYSSWEDRIYTVDVTSKTNPTISGSCESLAGRRIAVKGNYAYVTMSSGALHVVDISVPSAPTIVGRVTLSDPRGIVCDPNRDYVYIAADANFHIVDISTPATPTVHTTKSVNSYNYTGADFMEKSGSYYLVLAGLGIGVWDVTDINSIVQIDQKPSGTQGYDIHCLDRALSNRTSRMYYTGSGSIVSRKWTPTHTIEDTGRNTGTCNSEPYGFDIYNTTFVYAYIATDDGIEIWDVTRGATPAEEQAAPPDIPPPMFRIASLAIPGGCLDVSSNTITRRYIHAVGANGLFTIDLVDPANPNPSIVGSCSLANTGRAMAMVGNEAYVVSGGLEDCPGLALWPSPGYLADRGATHIIQSWNDDGTMCWAWLGSKKILRNNGYINVGDYDANAWLAWAADKGLGVSDLDYLPNDYIFVRTTPNQKLPNGTVWEEPEFDSKEDQDYTIWSETCSAAEHHVWNGSDPEWADFGSSPWKDPQSYIIGCGGGYMRKGTLEMRHTRLGYGFGVVGSATDKYNLIAAFVDASSTPNELLLLIRRGHEDANAWLLWDSAELDPGDTLKRGELYEVELWRDGHKVSARVVHFDSTTKARTELATITDATWPLEEPMVFYDKRNKWKNHDNAKLGILCNLSVPETRTMFVDEDTQFVARALGNWSPLGEESYAGTPDQDPYDAAPWLPAYARNVGWSLFDNWTHFEEGEPLHIGDEELKVAFGMTTSDWRSHYYYLINRFVPLADESDNYRVKWEYDAAGPDITANCTSLLDPLTGSTWENGWIMQFLYGPGVNVNFGINDVAIATRDIFYPFSIRAATIEIDRAKFTSLRESDQFGEPYSYWMVLPGFRVWPGDDAGMWREGQTHTENSIARQHWNDKITIRGVWAYDDSADKTLDWVLRDIAVKAGVLDFDDTWSIKHDDLVLSGATTHYTQWLKEYNPNLTGAMRPYARWKNFDLQIDLNRALAVGELLYILGKANSTPVNFDPWDYGGPGAVEDFSGVMFYLWRKSSNEWEVGLHQTNTSQDTWQDIDKHIFSGIDATHLRVVCYERFFTMYANNRYLCTMWAGPRYVYDLDSSDIGWVPDSLDTLGYIAVGAYDAGGLTADVKQRELWAWTTDAIMDSRTSAMDAMARVIKDRRVKTLERVDQAARIFKLKFSLFDYPDDLGTVTDHLETDPEVAADWDNWSRMLILEDTRQMTDRVPTHVRVSGYEISDRIDHESAAKFGLLFVSHSVPDLEEKEAYQEARRLVEDALAQSGGHRITMAAQPNWEVEDKLELLYYPYDGGALVQDTFVVDGIQLQFNPGNLSASAAIRKYYGKG